MDPTYIMRFVLFPEEEEPLARSLLLFFHLSKSNPPLQPMMHPNGGRLEMH
jgi:hypothetical protein